MPADRSGPAELLYASEYSKWPFSWTRDGQFLAIEEELV